MQTINEEIFENDKIIYYAVYHSDYDRDLPYMDLLYQLRRDYFQNHKGLKNKVSHSYEGVDYRYSYSLNDNGPMKWKKMVDSIQVEKSRVVENGNYFIETFDDSKHLIKAILFSSKHLWVKNEYFKGFGKNRPVLTISKEENNLIINEYKDYGDDNETILFPCEYLYDEDERSKINSFFGEPKVFARTNKGDFYYCDIDTAQKRTEAIQRLRSIGEEPLFSYEDENNMDIINLDGNGLNNHENSEEQELGLSVLEKEQELIDYSKQDEELREMKEKIDKEYMQDIKESVDKNYVDEQDSGNVVNANEVKEDKEYEVNTSNSDSDEKNINISLNEEYENSCICSAANAGCPYVNKSKFGINSSKADKCFYFGEVKGCLREGIGRTAMPNGRTSYEGRYYNDKRDGFGTYYYSDSQICYVGRWKNDERHGTGIYFRPKDGTITVGNWANDNPVGVSYCFDGKGNLIYAGREINGKRNGVGVSYSAKDYGVFVGQWKDGKLTDKGTLFDINGNLLYTGAYRDGKRNGIGTEYNENGDVVYVGEWKDDKYDGNGTLKLPNGNCIKGDFKKGKVSGRAEEFDKHGFKIYEGEWLNNKYSGKGCKFFEDGGHYEGEFLDGEPNGYLCGYNLDGELIYQGEWKDDKYCGEGSYFINGSKVYEGSFVDNKFEGIGVEYANDVYVYSGEFKDNKRCGFGTFYVDGKPVYSGNFENNLYNGVGILFENGVPKFAGEFLNGMKNGRVNKLKDGMICEEGIYKNDKLCYCKRYNIDEYGNMSLVYEGNIRDNLPNGMGCKFNEYGEKEYEGLFADGELIKSIKIKQIDFTPLPEYDMLNHTDYNNYRKGPNYVVEKQFDLMTYTGLLKNGVPQGKGTAVYVDHVYSGNFSEGVACGYGVLYQNSGDIMKGKFLINPQEGSTKLSFADFVEYNFINE